MQVNQLCLVPVASLVLLSCLLATQAVATPVIGVPNIIYKITESATLNYRGGKTESGSMSMSSVVSSQVSQELPLFNADVRGELIKTGHYRIVDMKNKFALSQSQLNQALSARMVRQLNSDMSESANFSALSVSAEAESRSEYLKPDYILVGFLTNRDSGENIYPLAYSNKVTQTYITDVLIEYRLIDARTKQVVASFSASGHGSDMKIMTNNADGRVIHYNYTKALADAGKDLAKNVLFELDSQFNISEKLKQDEAPRVITDIKTYTND